MVDDLQAQVLHIFIQEGSDLLDDLDRALLEIEEDPNSRELLGQFMRTAHTLKGSAGTVGLPAFSEAAHAIEDVVDAMRRRAIPPSPRLFDQLSHAIDAMLRSLHALVDGDGESPELAQVEAELRLLASTEDEVDGPDDAGDGASSEFVLGEYDHVRLNVARKRDMKIYRIELHISGVEGDPAQFGADFVKRVRDHADVVTTTPPAAQFEDLAAVRRLLILATSKHSQQELSQHLYLENASQPLISDFAEERNQTGQQKFMRLSAHDNTMRVEMGVLDELLRLVGELVINRSRLDSVSVDFAQELGDAELAGVVEDASAALGRIAAQFQNAIMQARLVPIDRLFRSVKRCVRDTSRWLSRSMRLTTRGEQTLIDQGLLETLRSPLLELLQVLVVGSTASGLDVQTALLMSSRREGDNVYVEIDTDAHEVGQQDLDPIADEVRVMRGLLNTAPGNVGRRYTLAFPATQVILPSIIAEVGDELYAFPMETIQELMPVSASPIYRVTGAPTTTLRGNALPLVFLNEALDVESAHPNDDSFIVVVGTEHDTTGVVVPNLLGKRIIVRKPLGRRFANNHIFSGATILANGQIALILDVAALLKHAAAQTRRSAGILARQHRGGAVDAASVNHDVSTRSRWA